MESAERRRLEGAGCRVGTVRESPGPNETGPELVEMRVALTPGPRPRRERARLTRGANRLRWAGLSRARS